MFDYDIYEATSKSEGCTETINATINYIDEVFDNYLEEGKDKDKYDEVMEIFKT